VKAKKQKINGRDLLVGVIIGFLIAIILSSIFNAYVFKRIITQNRAQSEQIKFLLENN